MAKRKRRTKRMSNIPMSPYHHKTEMPGVPGHHRLHGTALTCLNGSDINKAVSKLPPRKRATARAALKRFKCF